MQFAGHQDSALERDAVYKARFLGGKSFENGQQDKARFFVLKAAHGVRIVYIAGAPVVDRDLVSVA
ncbi:MAG TPA: hypothetical protein VK256_07180 [Candidatus Eisenbacteria bacterium]|nr:hypothetical protein [Candidatus Eisenbacteria bacterium]